MRNPIEFACFFCGVVAGAPCLSVGKLPIVEPHMQRLRLAGDVNADGTDPRRDSYARSVVTLIFGRCDAKLLERARKERSIDARKPWVQRALQAGEADA